MTKGSSKNTQTSYVCTLSPSSSRRVNLIKHERSSGPFTSTELVLVAHNSMAVYNQHLRPTKSSLKLFKVFAILNEFKLPVCLVIYLFCKLVCLLRLSQAKGKQSVSCLLLDRFDNESEPSSSYCIVTSILHHPKLVNCLIFRMLVVSSIVLCTTSLNFGKLTS